MKRIITLIAAVMIVAAGAMAQKGEKSVGLKGGYATQNHSATAGIYFQYDFSNHFRLSPDVDYVFRKHGTDALLINVNAQFPFRFAAGRLCAYPLAGLSYSMSTYHNVASTDGSDGGNERTNRFGLNFGAGFEARLTPSLKIFAEGKYNWVRHYDGGMFAIGIGYIF